MLGVGQEKWYTESFFLLLFLFPFNYPSFRTLVSWLCTAGNECRETHSRIFAGIELGPWGNAPLNLSPSSELIKGRNLRKPPVLWQFLQFPQTSRNVFPTQSQWPHLATASRTSAFGPCLLYLDLTPVANNPLLEKGTSSALLLPSPRHPYSDHGHLGYWKFLAILNKVSINIYVHMYSPFVQIYFHFFWINN